MPEVKLVSWTANPVELLFATEKFAKTDRADNPLLLDVNLIAFIRKKVKEAVDGDITSINHSIDLHQGIKYRMQLQDWLQDAFPELRGTDQDWVKYNAIVEEWALKVATMNLPIAEQVSFNFQVSGVTIAWREQLVRHRLGSYWIQGGRITDNTTFFDRSAFHNPFLDSTKDIKFPEGTTLTISNPDPEKGQEILKFSSASELFNWIMETQQEVCALLKHQGAKDEDVREMIGSGIHHRLTMRFDLRSLSGLLKHRTCAIAQGHWSDVVIGIIRELTTKVDPFFQVLGYPPCLNAEQKFTHCHYGAIAEERYLGKDPLPTCPLWHSQKTKEFKAATEAGKDPPDAAFAAEGPLTADQLREKGRWDDERNRQLGILWGKKDL